MSRSIFTCASSRLRRAISNSVSLKGRLLLPTSFSLPYLCAATQLCIVLEDMFSLRPASFADNCPSVTSFTASIRNSFVYRPLGNLSIVNTSTCYSIPSPWCPLFLTYFIFWIAKAQRSFFEAHYRELSSDHPFRQASLSECQLHHHT